MSESEPARGAAAAGSDTLSQAWTIVASASRVLVPSTLLVSLFFYFGLRYTQDHYLQYGLDDSALGFSTTDYAVRSLNVIVEPARAVAAAAVAAVALHLALVAALHSIGHGRPGVGARMARLLGAVLVAAGTAGSLLFWSPGRLDVGPVTSSAWWLASVLAILYGLYLGRKFTQPASHVARVFDEALGERERRAVGSFLLAMAIVLIAHGAFELTRAYAHDRALQQALDNEAKPWNFPIVRLYSTTDLALDDRLDVRETVLSSDADAYRYRYENLRLFLQQNQHLVLWPADRSPRSGMFILRESDQLRVEYIPELR